MALPKKQTTYNKRGIESVRSRSIKARVRNTNEEKDKDKDKDKDLEFDESAAGRTSEEYPLHFSEGKATTSFKKEAALKKSKRKAKQILVKDTLNAPEHKSNKTSPKGRKFQKRKSSESVQHVSLPSHWPISSTKPTNYHLVAPEYTAEPKNFTGKANRQGSVKMGDSSRLKPGSALLSCSGSDIQLTKSATSRPNLSIHKGRFLILLPGQLSFKTTVSPTQQSEAFLTKNMTEAAAVSTPAPLADMLNTQHTGTETTISHKSLPVTQEAFLFGKLDNLETDTPTLTIPFGSVKKNLVLTGRKIQTSTIFMSLTFKPSSQGTGNVSCKDIFSHIIAFAEGHWQEFCQETLATQVLGVDNNEHDCCSNNSGSDDESIVDNSHTATSEARERALGGPKKETGSVENHILIDDSDELKDDCLFKNLKESSNRIMSTDLDAVPKNFSAQTPFDLTTMELSPPMKDLQKEVLRTEASIPVANISPRRRRKSICAKSTTSPKGKKMVLDFFDDGFSFLE